MKKIFLVFLSILVIMCGCCGCDCESDSNPDPDPQITGVVVDVKVYPALSFLTSPITSIEFEDGRIVYFRGVYYGDKGSLQKGECYIITYSEWNNKIIRVEKCDT